ncbi:MAG TPA: hypothetical protein VGE11_08160 [Pseudonocardia sp.]
MGDARPYRDLLYTDFDGAALASPHELIGEGLEDDRHLLRVPGLLAVVDDEAAEPLDRLFACLALTGWGEAGGYRAVAAAARGAGPPPWHGLSRDRFRSADDTFGLLAAQVGLSDAMAERKGTESARLEALRALLAIADRAGFGEQLGAALFTAPAAAVAADIVAAARRGLARLDRKPWPPFDLPAQIVDILEPLVEVDEPTAIALAEELVRRDANPHTLSFVAFLVATGRTRAAAALGERIVAVGGPDVRERLAAARARRGGGPSWAGPGGAAHLR